MIAKANSCLDAVLEVLGATVELGTEMRMKVFGELQGFGVGSVTAIETRWSSCMTWNACVGDHEVQQCDGVLDWVKDYKLPIEGWWCVLVGNVSVREMPCNFYFAGVLLCHVLGPIEMEISTSFGCSFCVCL